MVVDGAYAFSLNTAALRAAGITRDSPDPPGGAIVKDAAGEPTGLLRNVGDLLARFRPAPRRVPLDTLEQRAPAVPGRRHHERDRARRHARGLSRPTRRCSAAGPPAREGDGDVRIPRADDPAAVERFIRGLPFRFGDGDDWLKVGPLKIVADGGILIGTSFMREPYGLGARQLYGVDDPRYRGS